MNDNVEMVWRPVGEYPHALDYSQPQPHTIIRIEERYNDGTPMEGEDFVHVLGAWFNRGWKKEIEPGYLESPVAWHANPGFGQRDWINPVVTHWMYWPSGVLAAPEPASVPYREPPTVAWIMRDWDAGLVDISMQRYDRDRWVEQGLEVKELVERLRQC